MSKSNFVGTSVAELKEAGVRLDQIVIGKPLTQPDGGSGHMTPEILNGCMKEVKGKAGVMYMAVARGRQYDTGQGDRLNVRRTSIDVSISDRWVCLLSQQIRSQFP